MFTLKYRLLLIAAMIVASIIALWPRPVLERRRDAAGDVVFNPDSSAVYDTVRRMPLKLGLDLQGGMHLALEIDESKGVVANKSEALDRALKVVRTRVDEFGVAEPVIQKVGEDRIIVELPGIDDPERATRTVQKSAFLQFQITDETQALEKVAPRLDGILKEKGIAVTLARGDTAERKGVQSLFQPSGTDTTKRDSSAVPTTSTSGPFSEGLQAGQIPGQYLVETSRVAAMQRYLAIPDVNAALPPGKVLRWGQDTIAYGGQVYRPLYVLDSRPIITGDYITDAKPNTVPIEGNIVEFQLNNEGGRRFKNETSRHIKDYMAIVLDNRVMSAPVIQSAIGSRGQITMGGGDLQEAQDLALVLRAGALPVPLKVVEVRSIGASLGQDAIDQGIRAGLLGLALVILIMVVYYRFSGFLAILGLAFYTLVTLAVLAGFDAVLTLPGIAGFVLSIGMAVDANFLIFERVREELDRGKTVRLALDEGFKHALSAIIDTHMTTALTAVVLYEFGTGPVRGFAVALLAGLAASMVSAVYVVRTLFLLWLSRTRGTQPLSI